MSDAKVPQPWLDDISDEKQTAWIQWKGTDVCIDVHCECGAHGHIDGDFVYQVECGHCGRVYALNGHVLMHELDEAQRAFMGDDCKRVFVDDRKADHVAAVKARRDPLRDLVTAWRAMADEPNQPPHLAAGLTHCANDLEMRLRQTGREADDLDR